MPFVSALLVSVLLLVRSCPCPVAGPHLGQVVFSLLVVGSYALDGLLVGQGVCWALAYYDLLRAATLLDPFLVRMFFSLVPYLLALWVSLTCWGLQLGRPLPCSGCSYPWCCLSCTSCLWFVGSCALSRAPPWSDVFKGALPSLTCWAALISGPLLGQAVFLWMPLSRYSCFFLSQVSLSCVVETLLGLSLCLVSF